MNNISNGYPFDDIWGKMRVPDLEPLSKEDGYRWGLSNLEYVKRELIKLEERALARHDVELLHDIVSSKLRAIEAEEELRKKLADLQK
ncbi:hypothetical protein [Candidatus Nitrosotalea okcheonensis]|uniref:Uncharacterized protein n=1 Tax=Candidatus Nitrosotalea okcheonensis TaxID=1903276 RepID=A0A2H1FDJ1_9ARCH|nr:hypothetical protein [Candidatus Nitrosotalea okcheonensis]SMH70842.1 conserved protein of unknown function [Candidatus Nitrosotalea okcheonensis]